MSWDAYLYADPDEARAGSLTSIVGEWNYTHNCNLMIRKVLDTVGVEYRSLRIAPISHRLVDGEWVTEHDAPVGNWYDALDGVSGADGAKLLSLIVGGLMEAPELFREMNPPNGWGDYDSLLRVLVEMRDKSAAFPFGAWSVHG